jgi:hypothetical protein
MPFVFTKPSMLSMSAATSGPPTSSARAYPRSASRPNTSCESEPAAWNTIIRVPAPCRPSESFGISSGSSGAYMLE